MVLSSQFQPNKVANATEVVGALKQDRHSGIMGELGTASDMIPVMVRVRTFGDSQTIRKEKDLKFNVFVQQKWTPYLMMVTLFNSVSGMNDFADESTFRLTGEVELDGQPNISLSTMLASGDVPVPADLEVDPGGREGLRDRPHLLADRLRRRHRRGHLAHSRLRRVGCAAVRRPARRVQGLRRDPVGARRRVTAVQPPRGRRPPGHSHQRAGSREPRGSRLPGPSGHHHVDVVGDMGRLPGSNDSLFPAGRRSR